jgi:hypothetical protein
MTGDGAVLNFSGPFPHGDGIYDLTARVFKDTRVLRAAYAALGSQVPHQLFLQHCAGLDEQAAVNRFVGHAHALVIGILDLTRSFASRGVRDVLIPITSCLPVNRHLSAKKQG